MMTDLKPAPLGWLSIQHCPRGTQPLAPDNVDRARALRDVRPVLVVNNHPWPHRLRDWEQLEAEDGDR